MMLLIGRQVNSPKYTETIGVNEDVKRPPYQDNVNDLESMAQLEGRMIGQMGDKPRPWFFMFLFWIILGGPFYLFFLGTLVGGYGDFSLALRIPLASVTAGITIIAHIPIIKAVHTKFTT